ncbi:MAG: hypothetical protein WD844_17630 [Thermoleophilaceae bacterium]
MGMFKQLKDAKKMVEAAPGLVDQSMQMANQAQQMAAAQQAAAQQQIAQQQAAGQVPAGAAAGPDFEPIAGVSLQQFAEVSKGLAAHGYDQSKAVEVAASKGISPERWQQALDGWNARVTANPAVAQQFNLHYQGA